MDALQTGKVTAAERILYFCYGCYLFLRQPAVAIDVMSSHEFFTEVFVRKVSLVNLHNEVTVLGIAHHP